MQQEPKGAARKAAAISAAELLSRISGRALAPDAAELELAELQESADREAWESGR